MLLHSGLRIVAVVIAAAVFPAKVDRDLIDRPRVSSIDPQVAAPGEIVAAHGVFLDRSRVAELVLSRGDEKTMAHVIEQGPDLIRFRVPLMMEPGKYRIVLVSDRPWGAEMIDQDVVLTVFGDVSDGAMIRGRRP